MRSVTAAEITPELCRTVAQASLDHLFRILKPGGKFVYSHKAGDITDEKPGYNMLRHCGTVWFMCLAIKGLDVRLSAEQRSALSGAVGHVAHKLRRPPWLEDSWPSLALVTRNNIKLGGVGLALLMLHEFRDVASDNDMATDFAGQDLNMVMAQLENYALLQISAGDFIHKRKFETGRISGFYSEYYTGEAMFGLIRGGRNSGPFQRVAEGLMRNDYGIDIQSHWMAYAACEAADRHMFDPKIVRVYLADLIGNIIRNPAYRDRRNSTPIACRSEALCRFLMLSRSSRPPASPFPGELVQAAKSALAENLILQLQWYRDGQFWRGDDEDTVQIDYVQHNGTAFLNWYLLNRT